MGLTDAVRICVKEKYADFSGRATRSEYWFWSLGLVLWYVGVITVIAVVPTTVGSLLLLVGALAVLPPSLAVHVRRLHDVERSGWWLLSALVPFLGLALLVFCLLDGTAGDNRYGADPKQWSRLPAPVPAR